MDSKTIKKYAPQKLSWLSNALVVHLVDFPIYYIECMSERHFIVAGGGGSSKTGVHNQINILELVPTSDSCAADLVMKFHTPDEIPDAIMTGSLMKDLSIISTRLVTGGSQATVYHLKYDSNNKNFEIIDYNTLTDDEVETEMKSVKYVPPGKILSGGLNGHLHVWDTDKNKLIDRKIKAHTKEIDEIDVDLLSQQIVTLSRDEARCAVWNLENLKLLHEFKKEYINDSNNVVAGFKFNYRSCRYAYDTNVKSPKREGHESFLLIASNPIPVKGPSIVYKLSTKDFKKYTSSTVTMDGIMSMTVSSDGEYFAIGTRSGSVSVFRVKNLRQTYKIESAHHNAVTNLAFLPSKPESLSLTDSKTCPLLSVSIDRRIVLHRPERRSLISNFFILLCIFLVLYLICLFLSSYLKKSNSENEETNYH